MPITELIKFSPEKEDCLKQYTEKSIEYSLKNKEDYRASFLRFRKNVKKVILITQKSATEKRVYRFRLLKSAIGVLHSLLIFLNHKKDKLRARIKFA